MTRLFAALFLFLAAVYPASAVAVDDKPLADPVLEAQARALMKEIRCLVCQNQSIEDSNADLARDLRQIVRERIALGDSPENVRAFLVDRYGDWVLLKPPVKTSTYFLWASPFFVIVILAALILQRRRATIEPAPLSEEEAEELKKIMEDEA